MCIRDRTNTIVDATIRVMIISELRTNSLFRTVINVSSKIFNFPYVNSEAITAKIIENK